MDPIQAKKRLYAQMGQYAGQLKQKGLRERYGKKPDVAPVPGVDSGAETLEMLKGQGDANKELGETVTQENKDVLQGLSDDELRRMLDQKY